MPTISKTNTVGAIINTVCLLGIVASSSSREEIEEEKEEVKELPDPDCPF